MKLKSGKKIALFLALLLAVPMLWLTNTPAVSVSAAATPTFKKSKVEITDVGDTYTLVINNKVKGSKYKYTSSRKSVATVSSKGIVTSIAAGTTTISCKITYPSKKTKTITCKVTVTLPADQIEITNETEVNGAHIMTLDSTFDFEYALTPLNSTDKAYWYVDKGDCITVLNSADGIVKATKVGKATLRVKAVKSSTASLAAKSTIDDSIIIEVKAPSATIKSADITSSTDITVVFDTPVDKSTVIDASGRLTSNITIGLGKDSKQVLASDYGTLTPSLSADLTTLTITASKTFDGVYTIDFSSGIKSSTGIAMEAWSKTLNYIDNTAPTVTGYVLDDTGFINSINFSEAIDITNLKITNPQVAAGSTADAASISIIGNKLNYTLSTNKKTLNVNLSGISTADYGKSFTVLISGIKDLNGNVTQTAYYTVVLRTDTAQKAQAVPISIVRTAYNVLTATYTRGIQYGGILQISGGSSYSGVVDPDNSKKVNYTISDSDALLSGGITVTVVNWNSYNVIPGDTSANTPKTFIVNFATDSTSPSLTAYEFDAETSTLTLTFTEKVQLASETGVFISSLTTLTEEIFSGTNINYTKLAYTDADNVIKLKLTNLTVLGTYSFNLEAGFVTDGYKNKNLVRQLVISNKGGTSTELQGPYSVTQSLTNSNEINLEFSQRVDVASAINVANYKITGVTIASARVIKNTNETGATVVLTIADGSIDYTVERQITIRGVMGYNGSYTAITNFTTSLTLKENKKPYFMNAIYDRSTQTIQMRFSEEIKGTMTVRVTELNTGTEVPCSIMVSGSNVILNPSYIPPSGTGLRIQVLTNNITDMSDNACTPFTYAPTVSVSN